MAVASRTVALSALLVLLTLSAVDSAFADPTITLTPTCGGPGTIVTVTGTGFNPVSGTCTIVSSPPGLIGVAACTVQGTGTVSGYFLVAGGASGIYAVTVTGTGGETASAVFTTPCPAVAVGGFVEPVNKLIVFAPYLALLGIVAAAAVMITVPWRKRN